MMRWSTGSVVVLAVACSFCDSRLPLDRKLVEQFARYQRAHEHLFDLLKDGRTVRRDTWEELLAPSESERLTDAELAELSRRQAAAGAAALDNARRQSVLDLDAVRANNQVGRLCRDLPKGGLQHVHGQFLIEPKELQELLTAINPTIDVVELGRLVKGTATPELHPDTIDLSFLHSYPRSVAYNQLSADDRDRLRRLMYIHVRANRKRIHARTRMLRYLIESSQAPPAETEQWIWRRFLERNRDHQGISYLEVTISRRDLHMTNLKELIKLAKDSYNIVLRFLLISNRETLDLARARHPDLIWAVRDGVVVGIHVGGDEERYRLLETAQTMVALSASSTPAVPLSISAGYGGGASEARDALVMGARRLCHALDLAEDPVVLQFAIDQKIPVETSLVTNRMFGFERSALHHPFLQYLRLGLRVSLSTDNDAVVSNDANKECTMAVSETDLQWVELRQMLINSIDTAFIGEPEKSTLRRQLQSDLDAFEARWKSTP